MNFQKNMIRYIKSNFYENLVLFLVLLPFLHVVAKAIAENINEHAIEEFANALSTSILVCIRCYFGFIRTGLIVLAEQMKFIYSIYKDFYSDIYNDIKDKIPNIVIFFLTPIQESLVSLVNYLLVEPRGIVISESYGVPLAA